MKECSNVKKIPCNILSIDDQFSVKENLKIPQENVKRNTAYILLSDVHKLTEIVSQVN